MVDVNCGCNTIDSIELDNDEEIVEINVYLSIPQALASEDAPKWIKAMDREKTKLLAAETWREPKDDEWQDVKQIVPIAVILTRKRDLSFKARACVLGNQIAPTDDIEIYAPVVSSSANRYLLAEAAASRDHMLCFDLDCAFLNAPVAEMVHVRLPEQWRTPGDSGIRRLQKALHGLRQAPRAWAKHYEAALLKLGWEQCKFEKGLYRKPSQECLGQQLKLSVYVDDNLLAGPHSKELKRELDAILGKFPGRVIEPTILEDGWIMWDILGSDVYYRQRTAELRIDMARYIDKAIKKFKMEGFRKTNSPTYDEMLAHKDGEAVEFPFRELIGVLQWCATTCRPDIQQPVSVLSRYASKPPTKTRVTAAKKILRYLATTPNEGLAYSPQIEKEFGEIYSSLMGGKKMPKYSLFADASFATCCLTLRSTSGSILYYRGMPLAWKCQRQGVRAYSTSESEYIAACDGIVLSESIGFSDFYEEVQTDDLEECPVFVDNQSAIAVAKSGDDVKSKSRHYMLRHMRVKDAADRLHFTPTHLQKADALTKTGCTMAQRRLLLHHTWNSPGQWPEYEEIKEDEEIMGTIFLTSCRFAL